MGFGDQYEFEIREIPPDILQHIQEEYSSGSALLESASAGTIGPKHVAWVGSFSGIVDILDPLGEDHSGSLRSRWYHAEWFGGNSPKDEFQHSIVFGQQVAVAKSLLVGKAKVVRGKWSNKDAGPGLSMCVFHRRTLPINEGLVFTLMPFTQAWSDYIWRSQIKPTVESINGVTLLCRRADDLFGPDVMQDIYESILTARIVIADITGRNANVFYELGMAHALGKEVILLSQGAEHIPFDLNRFRHCIYSNDGPGYEVLAQYLPGAIRDILEKQTDRA